MLRSQADFLAALSKIPRSQHKKVREFITRFQNHPTAHSINYESIHHVRDERVRWARNKQFEVNPFSRGSRVSRAHYVKNLSTQDPNDALGGGKTISDWDARFELAYQKCKDENVTWVGGVAPTAVSFARYLWRKHKVYPKDLWQTQIVTLGSMPGINTCYRPALRVLYGPVAIRETVGGATECMFGQQRDEKRASRTRPNYDLFFFEVETWPERGRRAGSGIKMLHEMQAAKDAAW